VNTCESAIQVVTEDKPKRLTGLGQKAPEGGMPSLTCGIVDHRPPGRQQTPHPTSSWKRNVGTPYISPAREREP
jgi:hypothetical protein